MVDVLVGGNGGGAEVDDAVSEVEGGEGDVEDDEGDL